MPAALAPGPSPREPSPRGPSPGPSPKRHAAGLDPSPSPKRVAAAPSVPYHEKQLKRWCGLHCLNALEQRAAFTRRQLKGFADQLFIACAAIDDDTASEGIRGRAGTVRAPASHTFGSASDGDVDVQVLIVALQSIDRTVAQLPAGPPPSPEETANVRGLLLHEDRGGDVGEHWWALRRLGDDWYDLDSLLDGGEVVARGADAFRALLETHLSSLSPSGERRSVYLVHGLVALPPPPPPPPPPPEAAAGGRSSPSPRSSPARKEVGPPEA